ncbi:MAG: DNA replication and repair protein RecF [Bacteroidota bacterium]|nr:DNA replication and repair protein RecF [Bacteroidota bacterium]
MQLRKLNLVNYKNFLDANFEFHSKIVCFTGQNGKGKTNILDSIYHLANTKSYFSSVAQQSINFEADFYVIEGDFLKEGVPYQVVCSLKKGQKKVLKRNGKPYEKFSDHIGLIPVVIVSPFDNDLIQEGSEVRRKLIDQIISQLDKEYLETLIKYQRILNQRNTLLKYFANNKTFDADTLDIYDFQLAELGELIYSKRKDFIEVFSPIFKKYYAIICDEKEQVELQYQSTLTQQRMYTALKDTIQKDRVLQYTFTGIHKDDLVFLLNRYPVKKFGSQGQQKSFLIALKLAHFEFVKQKYNVKPILLFDDVFDKLDKFRVQKIVELVNKNTFGQIFISDTDKERTEQIIRQTKLEYQIFEL